MCETVNSCLGLIVETTVAAHSGRVDEARRAGTAALARLAQTGQRSAMGWVLTALGFADLSVGDHAAAAARLAGNARQAIMTGVPEAEAGGSLYIADAAEALISIGLLAKAEPIVRWLEGHDAPWATATGARGRGLLLAALGDLPGAERALVRALIAHHRLPMPVERARSLLILGQVRRRLRKPRAARTALEEALAEFTAAGSPGWAEQAVAEIERLRSRGPRSPELTPAEERVARLAATGRTNREVASSLAVSHKTVEAHLARAYHKLGIRSRAELGAHMARSIDGGDTERARYRRRGAAIDGND